MKAFAVTVFFCVAICIAILLRVAMHDARKALDAYVLAIPAHAIGCGTPFDVAFCVPLDPDGLDDLAPLDLGKMPVEMDDA